MVTPISVSITAVDQATKVFQRVNANIERMQAPVKNLQRSFDRFAQLSGMNRLNEGFSRVRASATSAFRVMGQIAPILGTITGAVTVAGISRLATSWANFGSNLQTTSQRLGMSVSGLQTWQNGARLAGVSAESMTSAMANFQDKIWNARGGRDPQFIASMNAMHIAINNADGSARKAEDVLGDLADRIQGVKNPAAQAKMAVAALGSAGEEMLPFLREGSAGMARYRQEVVKYGVMNEAGAKAANRLRMAQTRLTMSVEGFGNSLAQSIEPVLSPIMTNMANWIAVNKNWISQNIAGYVQQLSSYLKSIDWQQVNAGAQQVWNSIKQFSHTIEENIDKIGGLKTVLEIVAGVLAFRLVSGIMSVISPFASLAMTIGRLVVPAVASLMVAVGPVGWAIAAAAVAIGAASMYIYKHWDSFKPYWDKLWGAVKPIFDLAVKAIVVILKPFMGAVSLIQKNWEPLSGFFSVMLDGIKNYFYNAFKYIGDIIHKISSAVSKVGHALGLTKDAAKEASQAMQIDPPMSTVYTPNGVANDNKASNTGGGWFGSWLPGGDKTKEANSTNQKIDRMIGTANDFFTSVTRKVEGAIDQKNSVSSLEKVSQVAQPQPLASNNIISMTENGVPAGADIQSVISPTEKIAQAAQPQPFVTNNIVPLPANQNRQQPSLKGPAFDNTLNGYIDQATLGSMVSPAQMKALIMTESGGRMVGNKTTSAYGFTQLTNAAAKDIGVNKYDPYQNVLGGRKYYERMLKRVGGNAIAAYGAYHDGGGSKGVKRFLASNGQDFSGFSVEGRKAMMNFQKFLGKAQGDQIQFNQAIPKGIMPQMMAQNGGVPKGAMVSSLPNMSNVASIAPITMNSGLGQLAGADGMNMSSAPPVNLPGFNNDNKPTEQRLLLDIHITGKTQGMDIKPKSRSSNLTIESVSYQRAMDPIQSAGGF